jgi:ribosomal protein S18 acetylase RimI-like enzyme
MGVAVSDVARSPSRSARFAAVRVAPERQRLGVGRALTRAGIDWARSQGYERLILDTTRQQEAAIALYESMGFRSLGEERFQHWDVVWFELRL